jgi:hypothetical protein
MSNVVAPTSFGSGKKRGSEEEEERGLNRLDVIGFRQVFKGI